MKIAVLEVGHWHAPLARIGLEQTQAEVVAVSARDPATAASWVDHFGCRVYPDAAALLASEHVEFAFVFDRHRDLAATARAVLEGGIACSIEKPGGMTAGEVASLVTLRRQRGVFASVPFVNRLSPLARGLRERIARGELSGPSYASFVDLAGSPARYPAMGCAWMLDPALAGGGCLINLGVHFIDLFAFLTQLPARLAGATLSRAVHGGPMEDHARLLLDNDRGGAALVEIGYCYPDDDGRHQAYTVLGPGWFADARDDICLLTRGATRESFAAPLDAAPFYADYVAATLRAASRGEAPVATLEDLHAVMTIVDQAYARPRASA